MSDARPSTSPSTSPSTRPLAGRIPNRFVFPFGTAQIWVEDDKLPLTSGAAREIANRHGERGIICSGCLLPAQIRLVRSHEPTAALCEPCYNPELNDAIASTRG